MPIRANTMMNAQIVTHGETRASHAEVVYVIPGLRSIQMTIRGHLWSMKNGKINGRFKNPKAKAFERDFALQVKPEARIKLGAIDQPLRAIVTVYYPSRKQDLDCALVYDCLQNCGVIANDRYIIEHHEYLEVDAKNPRVEVTIEEI